MKKRQTDILAMTLLIILCIVITGYFTDRHGQARMAEALLKQKLAKPTFEWITQHGEGLESVKVFNIASLVELERKRQAVVK